MKVCGTDPVLTARLTQKTWNAGLIHQLARACVVCRLLQNLHFLFKCSAGVEDLMFCVYIILNTSVTYVKTCLKTTETAVFRLL